MSKNVKARYWACVGYPESLPDNFLEKLQETGLQIAISPLHNRDLNPTGEEKKEHYHFILCYEGPTTYSNVKTLCDKFNMTIPIKLESVKGMYRYHLHLDNPEKFQYDDRDRILLNGFDKNSVNELTKTEVQKYIKEIISFINENHIKEYSDLLSIFLDNDMPEMFDVASSHTILFTSFLNSKRNKLKEESKV